MSPCSISVYKTAVGKFIAEHSALDDRATSTRVMSTSFTILSLTALLGAVIIAIMTWCVPQLFHQMPLALVRSVREGLLAVGLSVAFALPFGVFAAAFTGLQEYSFPTVLATVSRILSAATVVGLVLKHGSLVQLALVMAGFNVAAAAMQFIGWRKYLRKRVDFSLAAFDRKTAARLIKYGSVLSLWSVAALLISGLDILIVGHYDYKNTGFYAVASSATNFMLTIIGSIFNPVLPAVSSLQASSTPRQIGDLLIRVTRYCTVLLCLFGSTLLFAAYPLLSLWVGHDYAVQSVLYLEILVLGNVLKQLTSLCPGRGSHGKTTPGDHRGHHRSGSECGCECPTGSENRGGWSCYRNAGRRVFQPRDASCGEYALHPVDHLHTTIALCFAGAAPSALKPRPLAPALSFLAEIQHAPGKSCVAGAVGSPYFGHCLADWFDCGGSPRGHKHRVPAGILARTANITVGVPACSSWLPSQLCLPRTQDAGF